MESLVRKALGQHVLATLVSEGSTTGFEPAISPHLAGRVTRQRFVDLRVSRAVANSGHGTPAPYSLNSLLVIADVVGDLRLRLQIELRSVVGVFGRRWVWDAEVHRPD